jgi:hypothetical protein
MRPVNETNVRIPWWKGWIDRATVLVAIAAAAIAGLQWFEMRRTLLVDQRAWVSVVLPPSFPLEGAAIPASFQITNTGKTPAKQIEGDIVATVLKKGEEPSFDLGTGHPHSRIFVGAIFPNGPINSTIPISRYGPYSAETIVPTPELRQAIASGESFIIFYGRITYVDVFGIPHWTSFCTVSGSGMGDIKKCVTYNDVDNNSGPIFGFH